MLDFKISLYLPSGFLKFKGVANELIGISGRSKKNVIKPFKVDIFYYFQSIHKLNCFNGRIRSDLIYAMTR